MNKVKVGILGEILEQGGSGISQIPKTVKSQVLPSSQNSQNEKSQNEEIVKSLYEKSDSSQTPPQTENDEDQLAKTRNELLTKKQAHQQQHDITYYNPTFNPPKQEEARPAEKVEQEKQQEMQELQQKEAKKPKPLAVDRAQNIEKFRGASG